MKFIALTFLFFAIFLHPSYSEEGGSGPGGGGTCERRLKKVIEEISDWQARGGHKNLKFQEGDDAASFARKMKPEYSAASNVSCVGPGDKGYPVQVNGVAKDCINWKENGKSFIRCDRKKAYTDLKDRDNNSAQYKLMLHELASLAKLEPHVGPQSTYHYSNQITDFVGEKKMKFLEIKQVPKTVDIKLTSITRTSGPTGRGGSCNGDAPQTHITYTGKDFKGRKRMELTELRCPGRDNVPAYRLNIFSLGGGSGLTEGVAVNIDNIPAFVRNNQVTRDGMKLQDLFLRLTNANCRLLRTDSDGKLISHEDCPFTDTEQDNEEASGNQAAPAN